MSYQVSLTRAFTTFAKDIKLKMSQITAGEPEDQVRAPFENLMKEIGALLDIEIVCTGETPLPDQLGRPDYAVHVNGLLCGYVELKAPGQGVDGKKFKGRNKKQFERFRSLPNLLYCDGNDWALYQNGERVDQIVSFAGDISVKGEKAVGEHDPENALKLIRNFVQWTPIIPYGSKGKVDLKKFAAMLAPLCRYLRNDVTDALERDGSKLRDLAVDWRQLLFPEATDEQFADAYAQTVTFALLLGRSEGAEPLELKSAESSLAVQHSLLARALMVLTDASIQSELSASLNMLLRIIGALPVSSLAGTNDPWLYFYEYFLATYDPELRRNAGVYYTPVEVVNCQVRLVDELLTKRLGKPLGYADPNVITLDPAVGTGTYLLGVIDHALAKVEKNQGAGAVPGHASTLAKNLYGFEFMVGPYSVSELRISQTLKQKGGVIPTEGTQIYLTDTLESPFKVPPRQFGFLQPISDQHEKALVVKNTVPVIVCIGNPPYDRHDAKDPEKKSQSGGWIVWGDDDDHSDNIFADFLKPVSDAGYGGKARNLYNLYVYFWRWGLWKVFEQGDKAQSGIVSFITASSYVDGDAFRGIRQHIRSFCDEVWIIDLEGEGRGARKTDNVFDIQTPVCIAICFRNRDSSGKIATVKYTKITGSRSEKLETLNSVKDFDSFTWTECPSELQAKFTPTGKGDYFELPLIQDLLPWQHSGVKMHRTWPIAPQKEVLLNRWKTLISSAEKSLLFHETGDRNVHSSYQDFHGKKLKVLANETNVMPHIARLGYRSFDRQWLINDPRVGDRMRPDLWTIHGDGQIFLSSLFSTAIGSGPAVTLTAEIPDVDFFRGSFGAKAAFPMYRNSDGNEFNIHQDAVTLLSSVYGLEITGENIYSYVVGIAGHSGFTNTFEAKLESKEVRIPITKDPDLFKEVVEIGEKLIWLQTYGERMVPAGHQRGVVPPGTARCTRAVPETEENYPASFGYDEATKTLNVGLGTFGPVSKAVFEFEVSGLQVVQSWLRYRMKAGHGKKSSLLDDIRPTRWTIEVTTELLELLWVLEATLELYPEQARLLDQVLSGEMFKAEDFPPVSPELRKPPKSPSVAPTQQPFDMDV
jgi:hypothetical protein